MWEDILKEILEKTNLQTDVTSTSPTTRLKERLKETSSKKPDLRHAWEKQIFEALENSMREAKRKIKEGYWIVARFSRHNNNKGISS